jgi:hypothetical protein
VAGDAAGRANRGPGDGRPMATTRAVTTTRRQTSLENRDEDSVSQRSARDPGGGRRPPSGRRLPRSHPGCTYRGAAHSRAPPRRSSRRTRGRRPSGRTGAGIPPPARTPVPRRRRTGVGRSQPLPAGGEPAGRLVLRRFQRPAGRPRALSSPSRCQICIQSPSPKRAIDTSRKTIAALNASATIRPRRSGAMYRRIRANRLLPVGRRSRPPGRDQSRVTSVRPAFQDRRVVSVAAVLRPMRPGTSSTWRLAPVASTPRTPAGARSRRLRSRRRSPGRGREELSVDPSSGRDCLSG